MSDICKAGLTAAVVLVTATVAFAGSYRPTYFTHTQARRALEIARDECKPLVVHFAPDTMVGRRQINRYYRSNGGISPLVINNVIIVVLPMKRYRGFARELGITGEGGFRTISPFDLSTMDFQPLGTLKSSVACKPGFR